LFGQGVFLQKLVDDNNKKAEKVFLGCSIVALAFVLLFHTLSNLQMKTFDAGQ
jgi:hypothetical protein